MSEIHGENGKSTGKNRRSPVRYIVAACCLLAAIAAVVLIRQGNLRRDYERAAALREAGNYGEATAAFQALGNYADATEQAMETRYRQADALLRAGDRQTAASVFALISGYKDADARMREALAVGPAPEKEAAETLPDAYLPLPLALFYRQTFSPGGLLTADGVTETATQSLARTDGYILGGQSVMAPQGYMIRRYFAYDPDHQLAFIGGDAVNSRSFDLPAVLTAKGREYTNVAYRLTVCAAPYHSEDTLDIGKMLGGIAAQAAEAEKASVRWDLPKDIYGVIGHPFSIHYYDILQLDSLEGCHVWISGGKELWRHAANYGNRLRFACDETEAADYPLTIHLRRDSTETIASREVTVHILPEDIPRIRAILIGDSLTDDGTYQAELMRMCGDRLTLYGTRDFEREDSQGVVRSGLDEGREGWSLADYCTKAGKNGAAGDLVNPFFNSGIQGDIKFDFSYYMTCYPEFGDVTDVFIFTGPNDKGNPLFRTYYQAITDSVRAYRADIRVHCVMPTTIIGRKGRAWNGAEGFRYGMMDFGRDILELYENREGFSVVPVHVNLDPEHDIPRTTAPATDRNPTPVEVFAEGVHLNAYGYFSVADMILGDIVAHCR